ncbi:MAG: metallophosphoesterase [Bryobacteraceae bacterium]|nr:metallophosphoesterase [Bryobacteraceae bacterium]
MRPSPLTAKACLLTVALFASALFPLWSQPTASLADRLPAELRAAGQSVIDQKEPRARAAGLSKLVDSAPGADETERIAAVIPFITGLYDAGECPEASPTFTSRSSACLGHVARAIRRSADPALIAHLERWATSHPNPTLAIHALDRLADYRQELLSETLRKRILIARAANDTEALLALGRVQEILGSQLPAFLWEAPPKFEAKPASASLRIVAIGDTGTGSPIQEACANTMARIHQEQPFDFGITLGDNYQDNGPLSPADARWERYWERFYPQLCIPFYPSLGNHDWSNPSGPAAELLYKNPSWKLPALYYTYTAGPVQFFVINTPLISERQRIWLDRELKASTSRWKVVYGHFQIYSALRGDNETLIQDILPILQSNQADIYFCGHEHIFQHLKPQGNVHLFVNGAAGAGARTARQKDYPNILFMAESKSGFSVLEATESALTMKFIDQDGAGIYSYTLRK